MPDPLTPDAPTRDALAGSPEFSPLPPDAPTEDRIGTAVLAMGSGAAAAVTWFAVLTSIQLRILEHSTAKTVAEINPQAADTNFMIVGMLLGMVFAAAVAWTLMFPIPSSYRRGGLAMVAAFAGTVIAGILTSAARVLGGAPILVAIAIVACGLALWLGRRAIASVR